MPRTALLLLLLLGLLTLGAAPALAATAAPHGGPVVAHVAGDDDDAGEEPGDDWSDEDPGDDWSDEDPSVDWSDDVTCVVVDERGDVVADETCDDDDGPCAAGDDWSAAAAASVADDGASGDDPSDDWGDDDLGDTACDEDATAAAPHISALHATPSRRSGVRVQFRLDRAGRVTLALERVGERSGQRACAQHARAPKRQGKKACARSVAVAGSVSVTGRSGANATTLRRWHGHRLKPGAYRLTATPAAAGGEGATASFTLPPPAPRR